MRRTPLTPIWDEEPQRGAIVIGNTPGVEVVVCSMFSFTKTVQQWIVPAGVTRGQFDIVASSGTTGGGVAGRGGRIRFWRQVTPGQVYNVYVGGNAGPDTQGDGGGWPNGGDAVRANNVGGTGGGASYVILASDDTLGAGVVTNAIGVAGAGGGGGRILQFPTAGGDGGFYQGTAAWAGGGATQSAPGTGITGTRPGEDGDTDGQGFGGDGYDAGGPSVIAEGGGGGGGWHGGGGGGGGNEAQGGGGGSGWSDPANYDLEIFDAYNEQGSHGWITICVPESQVTLGVLIQDDFNRADAALTTPWNNVGSWAIVSNTAQLTGTSASPTVYHGTAMPSADHWVEGVILPGSFADGRMMAVVARHTVGGGFYGLAISGAGGTNLLSLVKGTDISAPTSLDTHDLSGATTSQRVRLEVEGTSIRGWLWTGSAWTQVLSATDSTYTTGTSVGFAGFRFSGIALIDDFKAGFGYL